MVLTEKEVPLRNLPTLVDSDTALTEDYLGNKIQIVRRSKGKGPRFLSS